MAAGPGGALGSDITPGLDHEDAADRAVAGAHGLRAGQEGDGFDLPARDAAEVGSPGERIVNRKPVDEHEHLVRPAAAHLGRSRAVAGAPDGDTFPAVERAREIPAPALELLPAIAIPPGATVAVTLSSRTGSGSRATPTLRSSPGNSSRPLARAHSRSAAPAARPGPAGRCRGRSSRRFR